MSIPSIGSYDFDAWRGIIALGGPSVRLFEQGGVNGYGVVFGGLKTGAQPIVTVIRESSQGDAETDAAGQRALMGTSVTVVDQFGTSWSNVLVLDVVVKLSDDPVGWMLNTTWSLLPISQ